MQAHVKNVEIQNTYLLQMWTTRVWMKFFYLICGQHLKNIHFLWLTLISLYTFESVGKDMKFKFEIKIDILPKLYWDISDTILESIVINWCTVVW